MKNSKLFLLLILIFTGLPASAVAMVVTTANDSGDGSLRQAIADAPAGSTLTFDPLLSGQTITLDGNELLIDKDLTIDASALPEGITIDANRLSPVLNIAAAAPAPQPTVSLNSLTITGGNALFTGGGIFNGGDLTLLNSTIADNSAVNGDGGGIFNGGDLTLLNSTIADNSAGGNFSGGGGGIFNQGSLSVLNSTISENSTSGGFSGGGGGIFNHGSLSVLNSTIADNSANSSGRGGGIFNDGGDLSVSDSTIADNSADGSGSDGGGGGIFKDGGTLSVLNSTIANNSADNSRFGGGGGILNRGGGTLSVLDSTIADNSADNSGRGGGGIFNQSSLSILNSTIADNSADNSGRGGGINNAGDLTLLNSTIADNSAHNGDGGGGIFNQNSLSVLNSTIADNSADNSGTGGGGIFNIAGLSLLNSTIADNSADGSRGPDILNSEYISPSGANIISDASDSGLADGTEGVIVADALLAPLGFYGGITQTMPPLPGSPAIDAAIDSTVTTDQRGLPRTVNTTDIGAVEIQDTADIRSILASLFNTDTDGDGNPFGVEFALGTNPNGADPENPNNLTIPTFDGDGEATLTFGLNPAAEPHTIWLLKRSSTLLPDSFQEIYRFNGPINMETLGTDISVTGTDTSFSITDENPPGDKAFYRFEAELAE